MTPTGKKKGVFRTKSASQPSVVKTTAAILLHPPLLDRYIPFKYSKGLLIFSRDHFVASSLSELQWCYSGSRKLNELSPLRLAGASEASQTDGYRFQSDGRKVALPAFANSASFILAELLLTESVPRRPDQKCNSADCRRSEHQPDHLGVAEPGPLPACRCFLLQARGGERPQS